MKKSIIYNEYCTGCGLCHSVRKINFIENEKGFIYPNLSEDDMTLCQKVCPASGDSYCEENYTVWGKVLNSYVGWSLDEDIRRTASSGGVLTALCCYLIDEGLVDGVIQTTVGEDTPYSTKTVISRTSDDVKKCVGSRYSSSSPLYDILQIVERGKRYAFVGKPCDVQTLRLYLNIDAELSSQIVYLFSFFCAGIPSRNAQEVLLKQLGCTNKNECQRLDYRGNGWPGFATAYKKDGTSQKITYNDSWGKILGRDVRKACKFCIDGIGEYADIVCADAWFQNKDGTPDFCEHDGRNVIFARNELGEGIVSGAEKKGYLYIKRDDKYIENFTHIQRYQYERRCGMQAMMLAMKIMMRPFPKYNNQKIRKLAKGASLKMKTRRFIGTLKRICEKRI